MATTPTTTKRTTAPRGGVKSTPKKGKGKQSQAKGKAKPKAKGNTHEGAKRADNARRQYPDNVKAITEVARGYAYPTTRQGPVSKQVQQTMTVLAEGPQAAAESVGLTRAQLKAIATGKAKDRSQVRQLQPLAARVIAAGGARQWVSGRPLAATLSAWWEAQ
jgi:hypothetical protein